MEFAEREITKRIVGWACVRRGKRGRRERKTDWI